MSGFKCSPESLKHVSWRNAYQTTDADVLCVACMCVVAFMAGRTSLAANAEQAQAERKTFANLISELSDDAARHDGDLSFTVQAEQC